MKQMDPSISIWHGIRQELGATAKRIAHEFEMNESWARNVVGGLYQCANWEELSRAFDHLISRDIWQAVDTPDTLEEEETRDDRLMSLPEVQRLNDSPDGEDVEYFRFREWFARRSFPPVFGYGVCKEQLEFLSAVWKQLHNHWEPGEAARMWQVFFGLPEEALPRFTQWQEWLDNIYDEAEYPKPLLWSRAHEEAISLMQKSRGYRRHDDSVVWRWLSIHEIRARLEGVHPYVLGKIAGDGFPCLALTMQACAGTDSRILLSTDSDWACPELCVAGVVCPASRLERFKRTGSNVCNVPIPQDLRQDVEKDTWPLPENQAWIHVY